MFRTFDILLIVIMTVAATITYSIKHKAETVLDDVHKLDAEIKLERDTIDLLKADWALATQPNRLARLADTFKADLKLQPTDSTQIVQPNELPMLKSNVGLADAIEAGLGPDARKTDEVRPATARDDTARAASTKTDSIKTGSVKR
ncbi:hypothetical protein SAMN05421890_3619 [Ensifer adhaerens]|nr:hypothetical protein SAMN05421890_3619 [Ensifer adhaerens]